MITLDISERTKLHLEKLMESGVIHYDDGKWFIPSRIDPLGNTPVSEIAVIEYVVWNDAAIFYLYNKRS